MAIAIHTRAEGEKEIRAAVERLSKLGRSPRRSLGRLGLWIAREARRIIRAQSHSWGASSGKLGKSITQKLNDASIVVGSNLKYAAVQHEGTAGLPGGAIVPKGHKYLAIPVLAHLRRAGVWPRDLPRDSMRFVPAAKIRIGSHSWIGPALVRMGNQAVEHSFQGAGLKGVGAKAAPRVRRDGEVMFALVRRSRIRGSHYLTLPWQRGGKAFLLGELTREATQRWKGGA